MGRNEVRRRSERTAWIQVLAPLALAVPFCVACVWWTLLRPLAGAADGAGEVQAAPPGAGTASGQGALPEVFIAGETQ